MHEIKTTSNYSKCIGYRYHINLSLQKHPLCGIVDHCSLYTWKFSGYRDFAAFGKCLGKDAAYVEKAWNNAYGKFDKAVLHLVVDVLRETKNAGDGIEEWLSSALMRMEDTDSALYAAKAIEKGLFFHKAFVR